MIASAYFILYVRDQAASARFYAQVLGLQPRLDVPGMTEFELTGGAVLGLMPLAGARRLLGETVAGPDSPPGSPHAELYLLVEDAAACHRSALDAGARQLSPVAPRDWGDQAGYLLDPDGHVLAFACPSS